VVVDVAQVENALDVETHDEVAVLEAPFEGGQLGRLARAPMPREQPLLPAVRVRHEQGAPKRGGPCLLGSRHVVAIKELSLERSVGVQETVRLCQVFGSALAVHMLSGLSGS
jgi:hypothetical protein